MTDRRLRILHCLRAPVGGLFRHVRDLASAQAALGHAVGVVCDAEAGDALTERRLAALAPDLALGLGRLSMSREIGPSDWSAGRAIRARLVDGGFDVVHGHGAKGGAYARLAALGLRRGALGPAAIYTPHGGSLHYHPGTLKGCLYMALERRLARVTHGLVFESGYSERVFRRQVGSPTCPVRIIPNGLLPVEFTPHAPDPDAAHVLFVGELRRLKGVDILLEALAMLAGTAPVRAVIVGAGPDREALEARAAALGLAGRVTFAGALPAADAFRLGRILVVPSRAESFPYIVLEAAAVGLPLIATDVGGIGEIVEGSDTRLIAPERPDLLRDALRAAIEAPAEARLRAARLGELVARRFTVAAMTENILALYVEARGRQLAVPSGEPATRQALGH